MIKLRKLRQFPEYGFTEDGQLWHLNPAFRVIPIFKNGNKVLAFDNNGVHYEINELDFLVKNYFGALIDLPIWYKDGNMNNISSTNIYFKIPFETEVIFESPYTIYVSMGGQLFKRIQKYPNYFISEYGLVYSLWWRKIMTVFPDKDGYFYIRLAKNGSNHKDNLRISRLVYETFIGLIPEGYVIDHYNGDITNNHISNLNAISQDDNTLKGHTFDMRREEIHDDTVKLICIKISEGLSLEEIYADSNIGPSFPTLQSFTNFSLGLARGFYFRHITKDYDLRNFHYYTDSLRKYRASQIEDACKMIEEGYPKSEISKTLGIPMTVIKNIYSRKSWKEISNKFQIESNN